MARPEMLHGESLSDRLARSGRLEPEVAMEIGRQTASALEAAHRAGIVHRDLKPDNIYLVSDPAMPAGERVKVLDFGIAKLAPTAGAASSGVQTQSMMVFGTPRYMSPEQCRSAANVDHRSDIYTLGCILFELVTGRPPFEGETGELIAKHQLVEPPPARTFVSDVSEELEELIGRMLAKKASDRPQTMVYVQRALEAGGAVAPGVAPTMLPDAAESLQRFTPPMGMGARAKSDPGRPASAPPGQSRRKSAPVAIPNPTTLSSATGGLDAPLRTRSKAPLIIGALALVAVVGGGLVFALRSPPDKPADKPTAAAALPQPPPVTPAPPPEKTVSKDVEITIDATPKAEIYLAPDGVYLGDTPYVLKRSASVGQVVFVLRATGFKDERVAMPADKTDRRVITLTAVAPAVVTTKPVIKPTRPTKPVKPPGTGSAATTTKPPDQIEVYK